MLSGPLSNRINKYKMAFEGRYLFIEKYKYEFGSEEELRIALRFFDKRSDYWPLLLFMLSQSSESDLPLQTLDSLLEDFKIDIQKIIEKQEWELFKSLSRVYFDAISFASDKSDKARRLILEALKAHKFDFLKIKESQMEDLMIPFSIRVFTLPAFKRAAFEFMMYYLSKPKVAGIDVMRGRIEAFIYDQKDDKEVQSWLISSLSSSANYLREEVVDLLGEMRISRAADHLYTALHLEKNPYIARSTFTALGKMEVCSGGPEILKWLQDNLKLIENHKFLLTHARHAISRIDNSCQTDYLIDFKDFLKDHKLSFDPNFW
ncbi:HEAT repeat domain-containing protein [Patescibacteria group bacterium]